MSQETVSIILTVVLGHFLALISPGPDFLLVVRSALYNSRRNALGVPLGIAIANGIYIFLCIIGVGTLLAHSLWMMITLKIIGGLFLLWVAYHALKARRKDYAFITQNLSENRFSEKASASFGKEFLLGLVSGLSNPKNILFYLGLFSVVLTPNVSHALSIALGVWMTFLVFLWDAMIVLLLTHSRIRQGFARIAYYVDKIAGVLLGLLGWQLLRNSLKYQG